MIVEIFKVAQRLLRSMNIILTRDVVMLGRRRNINFKIEFETYDYVRISTLELLAHELNTSGADGDCAEVGVYRGDFSSAINSYFPNRTLYLFDTFKGFDERDISLDRANGLVGIEADFSNTSVQRVINRMPHPEKCRPMVGYFPDTASGLEARFCFVSLDTDLYKPTIAGLRFFYDRLVPGGAIFVHDYNNVNYKGIKQAVAEFCDETGLCFMPLSDRCGSAIFFKSHDMSGMTVAS